MMNGTNDGISTPTRQGEPRTGGLSDGGRARRKQKHHLLEASREYPGCPGGSHSRRGRIFTSSLSHVAFRPRTMSSTNKRILYYINHRDTTPLPTPCDLSAMETRRFSGLCCLFPAFISVSHAPSPSLPRTATSSPRCVSPRVRVSPHNSTHTQTTSATGVFAATRAMGQGGWGGKERQKFVLGCLPCQRGIGGGGGKLTSSFFPSCATPRSNYAHGNRHFHTNNCLGDIPVCLPAPEYVGTAQTQALAQAYREEGGRSQENN